MTTATWGGRVRSPVPESERRLAAVMFTDMVGYTALMQSNEHAARDARWRIRDVLESSVPAHHGRLLQFYGDGSLSIFPSAVEAAFAAIDIQRSLQTDPALPLRIGIHQGEIAFDEQGVYGDAVNVASRIQSLGAAGTVLVSGKVFDEIENQPALPAQLLGEFQLKNVGRPVRVYALAADGLGVIGSLPEAAPQAGRRTNAPADRAPADPEPVRSWNDASRSGFARLWEELRNRRVMRTLLWYAGASVAVVEAANVFVPILGAPTGVVRLLAIAAVCGLPIVVTLSWSFDVKPANTSQRPRWRRFAVLASVVALSVAAAVVTWNNVAPADATIAGSATSAPPDPAHVAVVGFNTIGDDNDLAAFAAQLQVRLIDGLSAVAMGTTARRERQLRVLSHAGVLPFTRGTFAVDSLRTARRVGTVLAGTVEQTADGIGVRVRLVDTETGDQLHTSSAHVSSNDRIALLDALADSVLRLVRTRLGDVVRDRMRLLETKQPAAFDRVVWATHRLKEFDLAFRQADYETAEDVLNDADSAFAAAERLDPQWLEPIVERGHLARPRARLARVRGDTSRIVPALQRGIAHAERALQLNPADARALQLRGELHHYHLQVAPPAQPAEADRIRDAAEHDLRASLIGNHYPAKPLRILSELAGSNGRMREALQHGERAYEADPFMDEVQYTVFRLFEYSFALRQDAAAARWCGEGRKRFALPTIVVFDDCRLALGAWSDAYPLTVDSAWTLVDAEVSAFHASQRTALEPRLHAMVAAVLIRHDNQDSARVLLRNARSRDASVGLLRAAAGAYGLLGEPDSALVMLQTLLQRTPAQRRALQHAVELRSVAADPRIRALLDASAATGR